MKRTRSLLALAAAAALSLTACGSNSSDSSDGSDNASSGANSDSYKIAVTQIVTHASLDASIEGFKAAIKDAGLDVTYDDQNPNNDQTVVASIAG